MSNDLPGAEKFYSKVAGWSLAPNTMNAQTYTLLKAGQDMVGGLMPIPEDAAKMGVRPTWMGYIAVNDVKAYADKVKAAGERRSIESRPRFPTSGPSPSPAIRAARDSFCSKATEMKPRSGIPQNQAISAGTSCTAAMIRQKSFAFYSGLFGWTKGEAIPMGAMRTYQIFNTKGQQAGGMMKKMPEEPAAHWVYYITVDAIDAARDRVKAAGGQVIHGPMQVPGGSWIINGLDPQGAMFALVAPKK